jgi:hypothetical protein
MVLMVSNSGIKTAHRDCFFVIFGGGSKTMKEVRDE